MQRETAFTMDTSAIKYGPGVSREVGHDISQWGVRRVLVVTDPYLSGGSAVSGVLEGLRKAGIDAVVFDQVRVEPSDTSILEAIAFARDGGFDGYVAVGGGSSIDTAKAANLYATYPDELLTYVRSARGSRSPGG